MAIKSISSTGRATVYGGYGSGLAGFRQDNGTVYHRPQATLDDVGGRRTNPKAHPRIAARRSRGIGMGPNNATFQNLNT